MLNSNFEPFNLGNENSSLFPSEFSFKLTKIFRFEKIEYNDIPKPFQGTAIVLMASALMAIAFMGFSGMSV